MEQNLLPVTKVAEKPHKFGLWQVLPFYIHMRHIFLMIPRWVVKFSRETSGLKYRDEKGKRHCLCPYTINISILWVWLISCKHQHCSPAGRGTGQVLSESITMAESRQVWTEAGPRPFNPFHLYFTPSSEQYRYSLTDVYASQLTGLPGPFNLYFVSCSQLKKLYLLSRLLTCTLCN